MGAPPVMLAVCASDIAKAMAATCIFPREGGKGAPDCDEPQRILQAKTF